MTCMKKLHIVCKQNESVGAKAGDQSTWVPYAVSADTIVVSQVIHNILEEATELAADGTCITLSYSVFDK